jgi:hypothetical protein
MFVYRESETREREPTSVCLSFLLMLSLAPRHTYPRSFCHCGWGHMAETFLCCSMKAKKGRTARGYSLDGRNSSRTVLCLRRLTQTTCVTGDRSCRPHEHVSTGCVVPLLCTSSTIVEEVESRFHPVGVECVCLLSGWFLSPP